MKEKQIGFIRWWKFYTWFYFFNFYLLILEREMEGVENREGEREKESQRDIDLLFYSFMHSLADSCMCPAWGSNL